jgi:hypothetical protein
VAPVGHIPYLVELEIGGRDDLEDDPETNPDDEPIVNRREDEWWRPSYTYFMATSPWRGDPE